MALRRIAAVGLPRRLAGLAGCTARCTKSAATSGRQAVIGSDQRYQAAGFEARSNYPESTTAPSIFRLAGLSQGNARAFPIARSRPESRIPRKIKCFCLDGRFLRGSPARYEFVMRALAQIRGGTMNTMLYPELYKSLESVRWDMEKDIPWDKFDASLLTDEQAATIKMNAITEWSALPATEMFLRDNHHDSDFSAFMSVWFFEEQKHSLVLMEYLRRFKPEMVPTEEELHAVRFEFDPAPPLETLMLHFCGEIRLNHWYRRAAEWHTEPVIKAIYETISRDEARHGGAYLRYMKKALNNFGDVARAAFAKIGVLMASARRTEKPLHPTNLHVNQALFPRDTVQSRLPDPEWLERWLDEQIRFDDGWEKKVVERILHNLSILFERTFSTAQELNRYRKEVVQRLQAEQGSQQPA